MPCRAVDGAPFVNWQLPDAMLRIKDHYMKDKGGDREFVDLLLLAQEHGIETLAAACELAVAQNTLRLSVARQGMQACTRGAITNLSLIECCAFDCRPADQSTGGTGHHPTGTEL